MVKYQQGDVLFIEVTEGRWSIKENDLGKAMVLNSEPTSQYRQKGETDAADGNSDNVLTVAHGEVTGHSHRFNMADHNPGIAITAFGGITTRVGPVPEYINIEGGDATIKHEEHNPLTIPAGHYRVSIVREWDHIAGRSRYVVD
jgi:hypothetical protein